MTTVRKLLRIDGSERELHEPGNAASVRALIGAANAEFLPLGQTGQVLICDREAYHKHLPVNVPATSYYLTHTGRPARHKIRGDVVIAPAVEFRRTHAEDRRHRHEREREEQPT